MVMAAVESPIKKPDGEMEANFDVASKEYGLDMRHRESTGYIGQLRR